MMKRIWNDESGVLTFEWILLITLLVIGIVGGLAAVRDAYIIELSSVADAITSLDTGYHIAFPATVALVEYYGEDDPLETKMSTAAGTLYVDTDTEVRLQAGAADGTVTKTTDFTVTLQP